MIKIQILLDFRRSIDIERLKSTVDRTFDSSQKFDKRPHFKMRLFVLVVPILPQKKIAFSQQKFDPRIYFEHSFLEIVKKEKKLQE